jgi:hypothetical protein
MSRCAGLVLLVGLWVLLAGGTEARPAEKVFRAGASAIDITPTKFPVVVNGMFEERTARGAHDPLHARCLVLDDGSTRVALVVVDSLMMPRTLLDEARKLARQSTGIPEDHILIAATHTHSAPSVMGCLGSRADPAYPAFLVPQIVRSIQQAVKALEPARVGWAVVEDHEHTHCRRWIRRPDRVGTDPFGKATVRANMHPGYQNPAAIGPSGPVDPDLSLLAVQTQAGRPLALLANYSMHYHGSPLVSADYFGRFAEEIGQLVGATKDRPPFVGIMSQGTSGDLMWMDYGRPPHDEGFEKYAAAVAGVAHGAYRKITYHDWVPLAMAEVKLSLRRRVPDEQRLAWAKEVAGKMKGPLPNGLAEIYAQEQLLLHRDPAVELKLQAVRVGELGITAIPNEVFALTGLKIKAQSPLRPTFNIELANGAEGYIPPPEQHKLGGYTTWPARTAGLEVEAEPKIVETVLTLLEQVAGKPRRKLMQTHGAYAKSVLASKPVAYWRLEEMTGPAVADAAGHGRNAVYEDGIAFYLDGPQSPAFSDEGVVNRCAHFAGGRLKANLKDLGAAYSVELWLWNGLPADARPVTGYLFSRGPEGVEGAPGDHLGLGGTAGAQGCLLFANGTRLKEVLAGTTRIEPRTWHHVVLVRDGKKVMVYLDGQPKPEISGEAAVGYPANVGEVFVGGRSDRNAGWEGKIDEVAVYNRALSAEEAGRHYKAAGLR